jgi:hypothetical protein
VDVNGGTGPGYEIAGLKYSTIFVLRGFFSGPQFVREAQEREEREKATYQLFIYFNIYFPRGVKPSTNDVSHTRQPTANYSSTPHIHVEYRN